MKNKIFCIILGILAISVLYSVFIVSEYIIRQKQNENMIEFCSQNNTEECYTRMFELMLPSLLLYNARINGNELELIAFDPDNVMIDSIDALKKSDVLFGYGIYHSAAYEEKYSELFNKYSYAFDCGVPSFITNSTKCLFFSECIASDKFLIWDHLYTREMQISSGKVHTLRQKIDQLALNNKKIFVKIDANLADAIALKEVIKNAKNISGITMTLHIDTPNAIIERIPLLEAINKDFILISRHTIFNFDNHQTKIINSKYYRGILNSKLFFLSYINKDLIDDYNIYLNQNTDKYYKN